MVIFFVLPNIKGPSNAKPIYVDGHRYKSIFQASIDAEITFCWLAKKLAKNNGAPIKINNHHIVAESWLKKHPDYSYDKDKNDECR